MRLEIRCENRLGITQDVLEILVRHQIDLQGIEVHTNKLFIHFPNIEFAEFQHLMPEIRRINGVSDVLKVAFMPLELESAEYQNQLISTTEKWLTVSASGELIRLSTSANGYFSRLLKHDLIHVFDWIKGFNLQKWLDKQPKERLLAVAEVAEQTFQLELQPVWLNNNKGLQGFAGATIRFINGHSQYPNEQKANAICNSIVQQSAAMRKVVRDGKKLAANLQPVLLVGEIGVGKGLVVELMHALSSTNNKALIVVELTADDVSTQLTKVNLDVCGGLYLKHIDRLGAAQQKNVLAWLLSNRNKLQQVKLYASANNNLTLALQQGTFNEHLFYQLADSKLVVPNLRQRLEDVAELSQLFVEQICLDSGIAPIDIADDVIKRLTEYSWPGNASQLHNVLRQAVVLSDQQCIQLANIHIEEDQQEDELLTVQDYLENGLDEAVKQFESTLLRKLYPYYPSTRQLASKLGLSHTAIANKLREYGINRSTVKIARRS
ncbi:TyrR/PhhR family helix-turn-helix DNA-binding protein [Catenovulum sp. SX2]|uniref:TyrR/PhhR family helix-turn-helix DNA-binding protein n=1 Tax=Catenovulum sp. SX2 TaxID=3398614 RepID=UPI003F85A6BE